MKWEATGEWWLERAGWREVEGATHGPLIKLKGRSKNTSGREGGGVCRKRTCSDIGGRGFSPYRTSGDAV